jgi:hypothetical protein
MGEAGETKFSSGASLVIEVHANNLQNLTDPAAVF